MKMTTGGGYRELSCDLSVSPKLSVETTIPCDYEPDTIAYAVCRFLKRSNVQKQYVTDSYYLRFGRGKKNKTHWFTAPGEMMGLPESCVLVRVSINAIGVAVEKIVICRDKEEAMEERNRR